MPTLAFLNAKKGSCIQYPFLVKEFRSLLPKSIWGAPAARKKRMMHTNLGSRMKAILTLEWNVAGATHYFCYGFCIYANKKLTKDPSVCRSACPHVHSGLPLNRFEPNFGGWASCNSGTLSFIFLPKHLFLFLVSNIVPFIVLNFWV